MKNLFFLFVFLFAVSSCGKDELITDSPAPDSQENSTENDGETSSEESKDKDDVASDENNQNKDESADEKDETKRPSDLDLAMNSIIYWNVDSETYLERINIENLEKNPEDFSMEQLEGLVKIEAVTFENGVYHFTDEDMTRVGIKDVKWNAVQQKIEFRLTYNNISGRTIQSLPFSLTDYYSNQFDVDASFVSTHYLHGVHRYADAFLGNLLQYDSEKYLPELYSKQADFRNNTMTVTFTVCNRHNGQKQVAIITKELRGFKTMHQLLNNMIIGATAEVHDEAVEVMKKYNSSGYKQPLLKYLEAKVINRKWMQKMSYDVDGYPVSCNIVKNDIYSRDIEVISGQGARLDVYLEEPIWRLGEAGIEGRNLKLKMVLKSVNHIDLDNVSYDIVIPNVI